MAGNAKFLSGEELVEKSLEQLGYQEVSDKTRAILVEYSEEIDDIVSKITGIIRLITTSKEFQLA